MPIKRVNGINISYDEYGSGEPVLLVNGTGGRGREWTTHQVPALNAAGYRVVTMDNRGVPPTDVGPKGFTLDDMVRDTVGLIEALRMAPCRIVGYSLGGIIVQEAILAYPSIMKQGVLIATRGRMDAMRTALTESWDEIEQSGVKLPPKYDAVVRAMQYLSPATLNDERRIRDWLDIFEMSPEDSQIKQAQQGLDLIDNRLEEYRRIKTPSMVIGFQDDLVVPAFFCREIAEHIPGCRYEEIPRCGHYGYLEQPDALNALLVDFFSKWG